MPTVLSRTVIVGLLALLGFSQLARFEAPSPGATLEPASGPIGAITLTQGLQSILWTSRHPVADYRIQGWPTGDGVHQLGGGLQIVRVDATAGVIQFDERPMSLEFSPGD